MNADEATKMIQDQLQDIAELVEEEKELRGYLEEECAEETAQIARLHALIEQSKNQIADIETSMEEKSSELVEQITLAQKEITTKKNALKTLCYGLPLNILKSGLSVTDFNIRVSVSRTSVRRTYRSEELVQAHPELLSMEVDGDAVVSRTVDPAILDRLIAEEQFSEEAAQAYLIETKIKNPSVRITEVPNG
jgi:hypothetical protein